MQHRIAAIQMTSNNEVNANLLMAKELIEQAVDHGANLIVLPEMFAMMGVDQMDKVKCREKIGHGPIQDFLHEQAEKHKVWLVGGTIPLEVENPDKVSASCLVYNDEGKRVARYDKIYLFDVSLPGKKESYAESNSVAPGDKVVVIPTPFGKLGLAVCYDIRFPELFRCMQEKGAEIVALSAAFTFTTGAAHWETLVRARAIENLFYMVASAQTGTHPGGRKTFGHSMIVNPWGDIKASLPQKPGVIVSEIHLDYLRQVRQEFPVLSHRKELSV